MENNLANKNLIKAFFHLDVLTLAKACVPATAHYVLVALGHWQVQHIKKRRINNTLNLINCLFTYYIELKAKHRWLASCHMGIIFLDL